MEERIEKGEEEYRIFPYPLELLGKVPVKGECFYIYRMLKGKEGNRPEPVSVPLSQKKEASADSERKAGTPRPRDHLDRLKKLLQSSFDALDLTGDSPPNASFPLAKIRKQLNIDHNAYQGGNISVLKQHLEKVSRKVVVTREEDGRQREFQAKIEKVEYDGDKKDHVYRFSFTEK